MQKNRTCGKFLVMNNSTNAKKTKKDKKTKKQKNRYA